MNTTLFFLALSIMLFLNEGVEMMKDKGGCRTTNGVPCLHKTDPKVYQYFQYHKWNSTCFKYNGRKQRCMVSPGVLRPCKCSKQCGGCGNKRIPTDQRKSTSFKSLNSHKFKVSQRNGEFSAINKVPINMFKDSSNFDKEEKDPNHNCNVGSMDKDIIRKFNEIQRIVEGSNGEDEDQPMYKKGLNIADGRNEDLENKGSSGNNSELSSEKLNYTQSKDSKSESKEEDEEESSSEMDEALESKSKLEDGPDYDDMESKAEKEEGPGDDTNESRTEMKQGSGDDGMNSKSEKEEVSGKKGIHFNMSSKKGEDDIARGKKDLEKDNGDKDERFVLMEFLEKMLSNLQKGNNSSKQEGNQTENAMDSVLLKKAKRKLYGAANFEILDDGERL